MQRRTALAAAPAALAGCMSLFPSPDAEATEMAIHEKLNAYRGERDLPALPMDGTLRDRARAHSRDMAERDYYAHTSPDGVGPSERAGCAAGETLHRGDVGEMRNRGSEQSWNTINADGVAGYVAEGWRLSDAHSELIASPRWQTVGVGVHVTDTEFFATALFC